MQLLPQPNLGYFYLDMAKVRTELFKLSEANTDPIPPEAKAILNSLEALALTVSLPDQTTSQFDLVLTVKSEKSPQ